MSALQLVYLFLPLRLCRLRLCWSIELRRHISLCQTTTTTDGPRSHSARRMRPVYVIRTLFSPFSKFNWIQSNPTVCGCVQVHGIALSLYVRTWERCTLSMSEKQTGCRQDDDDDDDDDDKRRGPRESRGTGDWWHSTAEYCGGKTWCHTQSTRNGLPVPVTTNTGALLYLLFWLGRGLGRMVELSIKKKGKRKLGILAHSRSLHSWALDSRRTQVCRQTQIERRVVDARRGIEQRGNRRRRIFDDANQSFVCTQHNRRSEKEKKNSLRTLDRDREQNRGE